MSKIVRTDTEQIRLKRKISPAAPQLEGEPSGAALIIRPVRRGDLDAVIEIDAMVTGIEKRDYWNSLYRRYGEAVATGQHFLVAVTGDEVTGFVIGEVRDWEFGSPPCGWVFAIDVRPGARLAGTATQLLKAICDGFLKAGVSKVRTMLSRDNTLILSFFRSQGMMIGPFIPLEMDLES
ncbi:MAG: GNAT family N-acetyltransferase [Rhodoferax sp.]|nr:GNAT family N-acetyltransferase [Rhodoferax sp.]